MVTPDLPRTVPRSVPRVVPDDAALRRRYEAYRRRQGSELLSLVPREAIRPLYRAALERLAARGEEVVDQDTLGMLARFCCDLLPLPPFEVWREDFLAHRAAHLDEAEERSPVPGPVTVEVRSFQDAAGTTWYASLDVVRGGGRWTGTVAFHSAGGGRSFRTGEIFREADAASVRSRFLEFDRSTLQAFLRSVRP